jgi:uncharacterized membrane protein
MEALLDVGMMIRWGHLSAGVCWIGLLWVLCWVDGPFLASLDVDTRRKVLPRLLPKVHWFLRWGSAVTWVGGCWYGFGYLARQDPEGTLHWFTQVERGQWLGLGFLYGSLMVFNVWFIIWPRQQLLLRAMAAGEEPAALLRWARASTWALRVNVYLSIPLLYTMSAGKHAGELGHDRGPFLESAVLTTAVGVAIAAILLHGIPPLVGRAYRTTS